MKKLLLLISLLSIVPFYTISVNAKPKKDDPKSSEKKGKKDKKDKKKKKGDKELTQGEKPHYGKHPQHLTKKMVEYITANTKDPKEKETIEKEAKTFKDEHMKVKEEIGKLRELFKKDKGSELNRANLWLAHAKEHKKKADYSLKLAEMAQKIANAKIDAKATAPSSTNAAPVSTPAK